LVDYPAPSFCSFGASTFGVSDFAALGTLLCGAAGAVRRGTAEKFYELLINTGEVFAELVAFANQLLHALTALKESFGARDLVVQVQVNLL
jgi:hypothetical protein